MVVTKDNVSEHEDPLLLADRALYAAKKQGRDCVVVFGVDNSPSQQQVLRSG